VELVAGVLEREGNSGGGGGSRTGVSHVWGVYRALGSYAVAS